MEESAASAFIIHFFLKRWWQNFSQKLKQPPTKLQTVIPQSAKICIFTTVETPLPHTYSYVIVGVVFSLEIFQLILSMNY